MLPSAATLFWFALLFIVYTYFLYPALISFAARRWPRPVLRNPRYRPQVCVVVASYNDAALLDRRIENLLAQDYPAELTRIVVVSDGSRDATAELLAAWAAREPRLTPLALPDNRGKAAALNAALELKPARAAEIIVFADARQTFERDVITRLVESFADPTIGSCSGELMLLAAEAPESAPASAASGAPGVAAQVGLYWRYEKAIRRAEATCGSMLGATGAIYAIRRVLWRPLPPGTLLDDFLTPMRIVLGGHRAIFDGRAIAWDRPSVRAGQEFARKVRTLAGNWQAFGSEPALLIPWRNPATCWQLWSHKIFRLLVPFALIVMLLSSWWATGWFYTLALLGQLTFYALVFMGWQAERRGAPSRNKLINLAYTFTMLNLAALVGTWHALRGSGSAGLWCKAYQPPQ